MPYDNLIKIKCSSKNALLMALVLVGAIGVYNYLVAPHSNYFLVSQRYASATDNLAKNNQILTGKVKAETKNLNKLQKKFTHTQAKFFTTTQARNFFSDMKEMARETKCLVTSLEFSPINRTKELTTNNATLTVAGSYVSIIVFADKLQNRPQQIQIESLSMQPLKKYQGLLECDMSILVYVMPDKEDN